MMADSRLCGLFRRPYLAAMSLFSAWLGVALCGGLQAADAPLEPSWPQLFRDDFDTSLEAWEFTDSKAWRLAKDGDRQVAEQFAASQYEPAVRSPLNRGLIKNLVVSDFRLDVELQSTARDYPHRDLCLFFGYQDPSHLYYVHLGQEADDHANQIFIVNDAPRTKISTQTTPGTPWNSEWHHARIVRHVGDGSIRVYFDDLQHPVMTAEDKTFTWGQVGVGSFDDTGRFDQVVLHGIKAERPMSENPESK